MIQCAGIDPGIVWFDAHGDVQTLEMTASGGTVALVDRGWLSIADSQRLVR
jgi:arginase family enzyme